MCVWCSLHWSDLHRALLEALPQDIIHFGTTVTGAEQESGSEHVTVRAQSKKEGADMDDVHRISVECDLVISADGSMSDTRRRFRPGESRRSVSSSSSIPPLQCAVDIMAWCALKSWMLPDMAHAVEADRDK